MEYFNTETAVWTEPQRIAGYDISQRWVSLIFVDLVDPYASDEIKQVLFGIESGEKAIKLTPPPLQVQHQPALERLRLKVVLFPSGQIHETSHLVIAAKGKQWSEFLTPEVVSQTMEHQGRQLRHEGCRLRMIGQPIDTLLRTQMLQLLR
jgi:hypothetical protein